MTAYPVGPAHTGARASADAGDANGPMVAPHNKHVATIIFPAFTAASLIFELLMNASACLHFWHKPIIQL